MGSAASTSSELLSSCDSSSFVVCAVRSGMAPFVLVVLNVSSSTSSSELWAGECSSSGVWRLLMAR